MFLSEAPEQTVDDMMAARRDVTVDDDVRTGTTGPRR